MSAYTDAVKRNLEGLTHESVGLCVKCEVCTDAYPLEDYADKDEWAQCVSDEGGFSWSECDCCGSSLGGDRYAAHALDDGEIVHLDICVDCLMYLANGDEPESE